MVASLTLACLWSRTASPQPVGSRSSFHGTASLRTFGWAANDFADCASHAQPIQNISSQIPEFSKAHSLTLAYRDVGFRVEQDASHQLWSVEENRAIQLRLWLSPMLPNDGLQPHILERANRS